jgi:hypothetical protein
MCVIYLTGEPFVASCFCVLYHEWQYSWKECDFEKDPTRLAFRGLNPPAQWDLQALDFWRFTRQRVLRFAACAGYHRGRGKWLADVFCLCRELDERIYRQPVSPYIHICIGRKKHFFLMHVPLILIHWCVGFVVEGGLQRRVFAAPSWEIPTPNVRWIEVSNRLLKGFQKDSWQFQQVFQVSKGCCWITRDVVQEWGH